MADTWIPRLVTLAVWALLAWSASFWVLQTTAMRTAFAPAAPVSPAPVAAEPLHVARVFGPAIEARPAEAVAAAPAVDHSARFALQGVVAGRGKAGVALLSVEGRPPRPYRVGAKVDDAYTLQSVTAASATLTPPDNGPAFTVQVPSPGSAAAAVAAARTAPVAGSVTTPQPGARVVPGPMPGQGSFQGPRGGPSRSASAAAASI